MGTWDWDPGVLSGLAILTGGYLSCVGPLRSRFRTLQPVSAILITKFVLGILALCIALASPLHRLGDRYLLSAHMVQYLLITLVAPPLLLIGTPCWLLRPLLRLPMALSIGRALTNPIVTLLLFSITFAVWHLPVYYELALHTSMLHIVQYITFSITAVLVWWPIFSPLGELSRLPPSGQSLYFFGESILAAVAGILILSANDVLYPTYAAAPRIWNLSAATDQQLAGVILWFFGTWLFATLEARSGRFYY